MARAEGPWTVDGVPGRRFTCFAMVWGVAANHARARSAKKGKRVGVRVRYVGRRFKESGGRDLKKLDFICYADRHRDYSVDPQWVGHKKKKKKKGA